MKENKKITPVNNQPQLKINPMDIFNTPRKLGDLDLVNIFALHLEATGNKNEVALYRQCPIIHGLRAANPVVQRVMINRYINNKLLVFRSKTGIPVYNILPFLANDGFVEDWVKLMSEIIIPFINTNNVFAKTIS